MGWAAALAGIAGPVGAMVGSGWTTGGREFPGDGKGLGKRPGPGLVLGGKGKKTGFSGVASYGSLRSGNNGNSWETSSETGGFSSGALGRPATGGASAFGGPEVSDPAPPKAMAALAATAATASNTGAHFPSQGDSLGCYSVNYRAANVRATHPRTAAAGASTRARTSPRPCEPREGGGERYSCHQREDPYPHGGLDVVEVQKQGGALRAALQMFLHPGLVTWAQTLRGSRHRVALSIPRSPSLPRN